MWLLLRKSTEEAVEGLLFLLLECDCLLLLLECEVEGLLLLLSEVAMDPRRLPLSTVDIICLGVIAAELRLYMISACPIISFSQSNRHAIFM